MEKNAMSSETRNIVPNLTYIRDAISDFTRNLKLCNINFSEDGLLDFMGLAKKYIRPAEEYDVITEDGYILKLFHIPGNKNNPILLCHGLSATSDDFLIRAKTSLIYMLAEKGFDIWAMNCRGNRYSRRHIALNPDTDAKFWDYSMHEIGIYDYKAVIDFILDKTGQKQLSVVGHSEGTSAFFILMTERPNYNDKIKVCTALAPVCYLRYTAPTLKVILSAMPVVYRLLKVLKMYEFIGYHSITKKIINFIGSQGIIGYKLCFNFLGLMTGFNPANVEQAFASTVLGHTPAGSSWKNIAHYAYIYRLDKFCKYDYGVENLTKYGSFRPPEYDLKKVTTNVALFAAKSDLLLAVEDAKRLRKKLPNVVHFQVVSDEKFNHIDYIWGRNAHEVLYPYIIDILMKYNIGMSSSGGFNK